MPYSKLSYGAVHDDKVAALVRAVAWELLQLGYRPALKPGHLVGGEEPLRLVAPETWKAMKEILAGRKV
jgi:hypothetical protein